MKLILLSTVLALASCGAAATPIDLVEGACVNLPELRCFYDSRSAVPPT